MLFKVGLLIISYLLGSIPFSIILGTKFKGIDVRQHGSGNPGGTNSLRFLGKKIGMFVLILDGLKAGLIVLLIQFDVIDSATVFHPLAYGVAAAFGHVFSIYIKFKGGKAVAATVGMMIAYNPLMALIMFFIFMGILKAFKYVSVSSTVTVFSAILIGAIFQDWSMIPYMAILFVLVVFRHRQNFKNIKQGIEPKVTWI
ncbi:glycerol-3-phosphate 1-O-acyltransferase PlsY [Candidatus Xianfuyuplasma coldseepsis]|uniref:Glycerol-3-phosphate acyltransferase n=1 Tax=Candidatus Xianfuyuplasma coldseepsis TaxID=2782163 RepID=A0A7L7KU00_9MOLU|nr:glycerol-3-phosphate 1-O-acyltransferase PlsY [Xianfuyuplasma coldseepsis]QMS85899.1 glycerol-3-phosphate 1-O-acyltransferase PlsY [Xianfuyuplasma coldseepsis]